MSKKLLLILLLLAGPSSAFALSLTVNSGGIAIINTGGADDIVHLTSRGTDLLVTINGAEQDVLENVEGLRLHVQRGSNTVIMDGVHFTKGVLLRTAGARFTQQLYRINNSVFDRGFKIESNSSDQAVIIKNTSIAGDASLGGSGGHAVFDLDNVSFGAWVGMGGGPWPSIRNYVWEDLITNFAFVGKLFPVFDHAIRINNVRHTGNANFIIVGGSDFHGAKVEITGSQINGFRFRGNFGSQMVLSGNTFTGFNQIRFNGTGHPRDWENRLYFGIPNIFERVQFIASGDIIKIGEE